MKKELKPRNYDNLVKMRKDIGKDEEKIAALEEQVKGKKDKLREAERERIASDVEAMDMSPEQLGDFLDLIQSGKLNAFMKGNDVRKDVVFNKEDEDEE
ncbi:MAG: DUF4315 family protein [Lachnospiraceae bacterium]|nr:DUF4315 family protein [Lachnospiraceae bacterium]